MTGERTFRPGARVRCRTCVGAQAGVAEQVLRSSCTASRACSPRRAVWSPGHAAGRRRVAARNHYESVGFRIANRYVECGRDARSGPTSSPSPASCPARSHSFSGRATSDCCRRSPSGGRRPRPRMSMTETSLRTPRRSEPVSCSRASTGRLPAWRRGTPADGPSSESSDTTVSCPDSGDEDSGHSRSRRSCDASALLGFARPESRPATTRSSFPHTECTQRAGSARCGASLSITSRVWQSSSARRLSPREERFHVTGCVRRT